MEWYFVLRWAHVIGASVLLGTGAGIAFFMLMAHRTDDASLIAYTARTVVIADFVFTTVAVIAQPLTGMLLAVHMGWPLSTPWIVLSMVLYIATGLFWLPVVWIQLQLRKLASDAASNLVPLPQRYYRLFRIWFACGFPAFAAVLAIFWLMIAKPQLW